MSTAQTTFAKNNKRAKKPPTLNEMMDRLRADGVEFGLNSQLEPIAIIPEDGFRSEWLIDSQRFADLVVATYVGESQVVPKSQELSILMSLIREDARRGGRRLTAVEAEGTEGDPIVQAVLLLLNDEAEYYGRTALLLKQLRDLQFSHRSFSDEQITGFANIFSRQLRRLVPVLAGYGVEVELSHKEDGSYVRLRRTPLFARELNPDNVQPQAADGSDASSSGQSSAATSSQGSELSTPDGSDGEIRYDAPNAKAQLAAPATEQSAEGGAQ